MQDLFLALDAVLRRCASEPLTRPSALRVASRALLARIDADMDLLARLSFLEGVANGEGGSVKAGQWLRKGPQGMREAQKYFGRLNPAWSKRTSAGLYNAGLAAAERIMGEEDIATRRYGKTAEDVVSSLLFGLSPITGERRKPAFFEVGLTLLSGAEVEGLHEGTLKPSASGIQGGIVRKFTERAREVVKHEIAKGRLNRRVTPRGPHGPGKLIKPEDMSPLYMELRKPSSPLADQIREILKQMVRRSGKQAEADVFAAYLDAIKGSARIPTPTGGAEPAGLLKDLEDATGKGKSFISQSIKRMKKWLVENAPKTGPLFTKLQKLVSRIETVGEAGWAQPMRTANDMEEILADFLKVDDVPLDEYEEAEEETLAGDRTVNVGPLSVTIGDVPGAGSGAYRFASK